MPVFVRKVEEFVRELDVAVESHLDWTRRVLRCAVARTSPGDDVLASDAHCRCRFGQWAGGNRDRFSQINEAATIRMFDQHERMHRAVRRLCSAMIADGIGEEADLADFEESQSALVAELAHFKTRLLEHSARLDSLTGLPLRYGLEDEFASFGLAARRLGMKTAVMMIDVDHFKRINDTYGHAVGDLALKHIARTICGQARGGALTFRFGGEEFLQLMRADTAADVEAAADRLLQALRDAPMVLPEGGLLQVRASAGIAVVEHDEDMGHVIDRADRALYAAKAAGRDCVKWAEPHYGQASARRRRDAGSGAAGRAKA